MSLVLSNEGAVELLNLLTDAWGDVTIGLYGSPHTPAPDDDYTTYALIECDFPGYARVTLTHWLPAIVIPAMPAETAADLVTWTRTAGGSPASVYGYFVLLETGTMAWAESDPHAPVAINAIGNTYQVSPFFGLTQC